MYKIKEIFNSIQGEGFNTGKKSVFVRFSGCNLWNGNFETKKNSICNFCDTDFKGTNGKNGGKYKLEDLIKKVVKVWEASFSFTERFVILTGGEPLLQVDQNLLNALKEKKFKIAIETNGTIDTKLKFDWVCVSPKENAIWKLKKGDELKIVFPQNKFDLKNITKLDFKYFFLQPMRNEKSQINIIKTIQYCKTHKPWFPSFQIHKSLGVS